MSIENIKNYDLLNNIERKALCVEEQTDDKFKIVIIKNYQCPRSDFKIKDYKELALRLGFIDKAGNILV